MTTQEEWQQSLLHCEELVDMMTNILQQHSWSAQAACELEAACLQAGETVYLLVRHSRLFRSGCKPHLNGCIWGSCYFMQALALCQQGKDEQAERLLARLGCSHRLAPAVMTIDASVIPASEVMTSLDTSLPSLTPNAVPGALMEAALHA